MEISLTNDDGGVASKASFLTAGTYIVDSSDYVWIVDEEDSPSVQGIILIIRLITDTMLLTF
jgi:hypothetical protein